MTRQKISIQTVTLWAMLWGILFYTALNVGTNRVPIFSTVMQFATSPVFWTLAIVSLIGIYYVVKWSMQHKTTLGEKLYRYRYWIAVSLLVIWVIFELNGSSIGMWANYIGGHEQDSILIGTSRGLRSDEWAASTSLALSQGFQTPTYPYFSEAVRGGLTDMFIVYGQPVWDIGTVFRPAYWGYLLLGSTKGLSFFWVFRTLFLGLTLFELGMIITKRHKVLSSLLAILITFSPFVQWWFAVNGTIEIIGMGSFAVVISYYYLLEKRYWKKIIYAVLFAWAGMGYILTFYPAWQVPMGYVFLILLIYIVLENKHITTWRWQKDSFIVLLSLTLLALSLGYVVIKSGDTLKAVLNTVYPGNRIDSGGQWGHILMDYPFSIFYTMTGLSWERGMDVLYDFFPLSTLYAGWIWFKTKDRFLRLFLILNSLFFVYIVFGVPIIVAKLTLMSYTMAVRTIMAFGIVNILLLVRALAIKSTHVNFPKYLQLVSSFILIGLTTYLHVDYLQEIVQFMQQNGGAHLKMLVIFVPIIAFICLFKAINKWFNGQTTAFTIQMLLLSVFFGMLVNPVRQGTNVIYQNDLVQAIHQINRLDKGKWVVEGMDYPYINVPLLVGASTINSTNVYPDLQKWHLLDNAKQYEDVYNRYAHIRIDFDTVNQATFELTSPDVFKVTLNQNDLKQLQVKYILSKKALHEQYSNRSESVV